MVAVAAAILALLVVLSSSLKGSAFVSRTRNGSSLLRSNRAGATVIRSSCGYEIRKKHVVTNEKYLKEAGTTVVSSSYGYDNMKKHVVTNEEYMKEGIEGDYSQIRKSLAHSSPPTVTCEKSHGKSRKAYHKVRKLVRAGTLDIPRVFHSLFGLSSILVGLHHMVEVLIISSFADVKCGVLMITCSGFVHIFAGLLGIRRLNFKNEKEAARNAMFWPAPIQSLWLASISLTEWGQGSGALFSMENPLFITFTAFNMMLTFWQFSEIVRKTGDPSRTRDIIWFKKSSHNAIMVEFSYLLWMQLQMGAALYIMCSVPLPDFSAFMDTFPKMQYLLSNLALNTAFFNNLAIFVATLLRYKVVSKPNNYNIYVFSLPLLSSIFIVWKVLSCFFLSYDGTMSSTFFSLMLK